MFIRTREKHARITHAYVCSYHSFFNNCVSIGKMFISCFDIFTYDLFKKNSGISAQLLALIELTPLIERIIKEIRKLLDKPNSRRTYLSVNQTYFCYLGRLFPGYICFGRKRPDTAIYELSPFHYPTSFQYIDSIENSNGRVLVVFEK